MNATEVSNLLNHPVAKAFAAGKTVQRRLLSGEWLDLDGLEKFFKPGRDLSRYRVKPTPEEEYLERQATCGIKVGDTVKVIRAAHDNEQGWDNSWVEEMASLVGTTSQVSQITPYGIRLSNFDGWNVPFFILEKVSPYAQWRAAHAAGKVVEFRLKGYTLYWTKVSRLFERSDEALDKYEFRFPLEPHADLKQASAEGKTIQHRCSRSNGIWEDVPNPTFDCGSAYAEYRVKPAAEPAKDPYAHLRAAKAGGKQIQVQIRTGEWLNINSPNFDEPVEKYRIKAEPKYRAWESHKEVPVRALCRTKSAYTTKMMILWAGDYVTLSSARGASGFGMDISFHQMLEAYEVSTDGGQTWHPCGVEIPETLVAAQNTAKPAGC